MEGFLYGFVVKDATEIDVCKATIKLWMQWETEIDSLKEEW